MSDIARELHIDKRQWENYSICKDYCLELNKSIELQTVKRVRANFIDYSGAIIGYEDPYESSLIIARANPFT